VTEVKKHLLSESRMKGKKNLGIRLTQKETKCKGCLTIKKWGSIIAVKTGISM